MPNMSIVKIPGECTYCKMVATPKQKVVLLQVLHYSKTHTLHILHTHIRASIMTATWSSQLTVLLSKKHNFQHMASSMLRFYCR